MPGLGCRRSVLPETQEHGGVGTGPGSDPRSIRCVVGNRAEMIRKARPKDAELVARILAGAMAKDPVTTWILHGRDMPERPLRVMFEAVVRRAVSAAEHEVHICDDRSGAALWYGLGRGAIPMRDVVRMSPVMVRAGFVSVRALRLNAVLQKEHPRGAHYYLEVLGTVPERQGQGVGGALLSAVLDRCDTERNEVIGRSGFTRAVCLDVFPRRWAPVWQLWEHYARG